MDRVAGRIGHDPPTCLRALTDEADQLIAILAAIVRTATKRSQPSI